MAASNNEETAQYVHTSSLPYLRSPLPSMPSKSPPPSVNDKKSIQVKDKQTIGTSVSLVAELCGDTLQLDAHGPLPPATGLPPALESVQFTATEHSPGAVPSGTDITIQLQTELVATANELYRKDIEVHGERRTGKAPERISVVPLPPFSKRFPKANTQELTDEDYWSSFPPHIKNFVRSTALSLMRGLLTRTKAQKMYNIAQQMVQSDAVLKTGFSATEATTITARASKDAPGCPPGAYPSLPFDPSIFSDPEFTLSVDRATAALGTALPSPGQSHRGPPEFGQEDFIEDDYSEDAVDGDVEDQDLNENDSDLQPHSTSVPHAPHFHGSLPATFAQVVLSYEETVLRSGPLSTDFRTKLSMPAMPMPAAPVEELVFHKKNKKVSSMKMPAVSAESPVLSGQGVGTAGTAPGSALEKGSGGTGGELRKRSLPLTANAMPAARAATKENISSNPPPSSRAQGKQPMSYAPPTTTATTTTTTPTTATATVNGQQPARTARAASKAPIPAHAYQHNHSHHHPSPPSSNASVPQKHRPPATAAPGKSSQNNSKIWSTSSTEERERIKEFWLGLGEDERRNLVKIEKDTVLRKMKEQQKHSCSCAVCGRKRHAIEEELEVLYDAYYEELEQYANYQQRYVSSGGTIPPPPGPGPFPGSVELDKNGAVIGHPQNKVSHNPPPSNRTPALTNGRKPPKHESEFDDDDGDEDEYEEEEEEEYEEDEEEEEEDEDPEEEEEEVKPRDRRNPAVRGRRPVNNTKVNGRDGLFNLGSSLTVTGPGNILTVADDLLKNDGQKFLEMMEQLAERRMQREEEAAADVEDESDEEDDEEGDEDDDDEDEEEEDDDDDDEEVMTEEQKMEEGKRMFSIFAARMFEQRVLQAFREKVAQERQMQLLRELEDEDKLTREREAKKQTQNQKKKAKKILQKQARDEERAAKAAEKAAEEAAVKAKQVAQEDAQRKKREEERARREAVRKAADEEKQRKEEERRKRVAEEKEREAERERKRKEKEEKVKQERREREEKERKAKEERDAKAAAEKAARDAARKEQQEKEERERKLAKEKEEKEKVEKERLAQQQRAGKITRPPTSPRPSGSAQRTQSNNGSSKKILNKPIPVTPTPSGSTPRPALQQPQQQPQRPILSNSQPATPVASSMQNHFPPPITPHYPVAPGMMPLPPGALSPRLPFAQPPPPFGLFGPGPSMPPPPGPPPNLAPSALPRNFGSPTPFESGFSRPLVPTIPIGPPSKVSQNPLASPTMLAPGHPRRTSIPDPGPVARPVSIAPIAPPAPIALPAPIAPPAPIARPTTGETSGSGSGSPSHRSPSPKGILGSSALLADDDEVVPPPGRRIAPGAVGQSWGTNNSPRAVVGDNRLPWGAPAPPGFGSPRPPIGPSLWGGVNPTSDWQAPTFFPNSFVNHINTSPPPHTG